MNELTTGKTMTVKEVADVLGVTERTIQNHVKSLFPNLIQNGKVTIITEEMFQSIKNDLIKNPNLKLARAFEVISDMDIEDMTLKVLEYHINRKKELEIENKKLLEEKQIMLPKAEAFEELMVAENTISLKEVAAILNIEGMGQNNLFRFLKNEHILQKDNVPYRQYIDRGYFRQIAQIWKNEAKSFESNKTVVTTKGLDYIRKLIKNRAVL